MVSVICIFLFLGLGRIQFPLFSVLHALGRCLFEAFPFYHLAERKGELAVAAFEHFTWQQYHLDIEFDPEPFAPFCEIIEKCGIIASEICRDYVPFMLDGLGYKHLFSIQGRR